MKLYTLFKVYERMVNRMEACRRHRGTSFGILLDKDKWAKEYQRHEKGFRALEKRFISALKKADEQKRQPTMIILITTKGKGVSFMENNVDFHGVPPNEMERNLAIKELELAQKKLEALL